jgi:hypothetical protein
MRQLDDNYLSSIIPISGIGFSTHFDEQDALTISCRGSV